jgi:hypothetical protein
MGKSKQSILVRLSIPIIPPDGNLVGETVWATVLRHGNYRIENQPVHAVWVAYHDIVKAEYINGILTFRAVVIKKT